MCVCVCALPDTTPPMSMFSSLFVSTVKLYFPLYLLQQQTKSEKRWGPWIISTEIEQAVSKPHHHCTVVNPPAPHPHTFTLIYLWTVRTKLHETNMSRPKLGAPVSSPSSVCLSCIVCFGLIPQSGRLGSLLLLPLLPSSSSPQSAASFFSRDSERFNLQAFPSKKKKKEV